jgi:Protein of unknown function (DUF2947)
MRCLLRVIGKKIMTPNDEQIYDSDLWYFSSDAHCGRTPTEVDRKAIRTLNEAYSTKLWSLYVSTTARHLMLMDKSDWPNYAEGEQRLLGIFPNPNKKVSQDVFAEVLASELPYQSEDKIYFFWMKENAVETTWGIFLRYWPCFFFDDEGPILIAPEYLTAIIFCLEHYRIVQRPPELLQP